MSLKRAAAYLQASCWRRSLETIQNYYGMVLGIVLRKPRNATNRTPNGIVWRSCPEKRRNATNRAAANFPPPPRRLLHVFVVVSRWDFEVLSVMPID